MHCQGRLAKVRSTRLPGGVVTPLHETTRYRRAEIRLRRMLARRTRRVEGSVRSCSSAPFSKERHQMILDRLARRTRMPGAAVEGRMAGKQGDGESNDISHDTTPWRSRLRSAYFFADRAQAKHSDCGRCENRKCCNAPLSKCKAQPRLDAPTRAVDRTMSAAGVANSRDFFVEFALNHLGFIDGRLCALVDKPASMGC